MPQPEASQSPRQSLLKALYQAQEEMEAQRRTACGEGCAACCTGRVGLTSLEGELLGEELLRLDRRDLLTRAAELAGEAYAPAYTCNQLARACLEQREAPAEAEAAGQEEVCFLLEEGRCAAYAARPLACRVMASQHRCAPGGQAMGDPWWLTLDTALLQIVEHLSLGGQYGGLAAILAAGEGAARDGLLACEPLPGLLAPPEHQSRLQQELRPLFGQLVEGMPLGRWMDLIRAEAMAKLRPLF